MDGPVIALLKRTGGNSVDEIVARVPEGPHIISAKLEELDQNGYLTVMGPKSVHDFRHLVDRVRATNGYAGYTSDQQRVCVLKEILERDKDFTRTTVRLSYAGMRQALG
jgi:hypothetical protein